MCFPHVETNYYQIRIQSTAGAGTAGTAGMTEVMVVKTLVFPSQLCWPGGHVVLQQSEKITLPY